MYMTPGCAPRLGVADRRRVFTSRGSLEDTRMGVVMSTSVVVAGEASATCGAVSSTFWATVKVPVAVSCRALP